MSDAATVIPEAEQRAVGKFLRRMLPILVLMLLVNQMDRTNVGFVQDELRAERNRRIHSRSRCLLAASPCNSTVESRVR